MAEYIELEKAIEAFTFADADVCQEYGDYECEFGFSREAIKDVLKSVETSDVAPVVRAKWVKISFVSSDVFCSECRTLEKTTDSNYKSRYCPHCGAKMDLE